MDQLPKDLAPGSKLVSRIVAPLQRAYLARMASYDPEIGDDAYTLGTGLWRSSWFFLEKEFGDIAQRPGNAFFLKFPDYNLYFYGDRRRGPGHRTIGGSTVQDAIVKFNSQICFDFVGKDMSDGVPNLVGLHAGVNPLGLTEVLVGLPVAHEDPDTAWHFLEHVFSYTPPQRPDEKKKAFDVQPFGDIEVPELEIHPEDDADTASDGN